MIKYIWIKKYPKKIKEISKEARKL